MFSSSVFADDMSDNKVFVSSDNPNIVYMGRISRSVPETIRFTYPGVSIYANFEGTSLQMKAKPGSGSFMVEIDDNLPYRINFSEKDSIHTLAEGLPESTHSARIMYVVEGYEMKLHLVEKFLSVKEKVSKIDDTLAEWEREKNDPEEMVKRIRKIADAIIEEL